MAVDIDLEDGGVVHEAVDCGQRHGGVWEDPAPFPEGPVCGDERGAALITGADEFEQHGSFRLILADISEVIEDQEMAAVEPVDGGFQRQFAAGDLALLDEVGCAGEQHAPAIFDQRETDGRGEMGFPATWSAGQDQIGAVIDPAIPGPQRHHRGLGDHRHRLELEAVEGLPGRQARFKKMALDAAAIAFGRGVPCFMAHGLEQVEQRGTSEPRGLEWAKN